MIQPGDVVTADFPGATGVKRRPCVVVSTNGYHQTRPDVVPGVLTSQIARATHPSDYVLQDWNAAGLHCPSAFRSFLFTLPVNSVTVIGSLTDGDWSGVRHALRSAIAVS
jgi:mRNA interferase MazF